MTGNASDGQAGTYMDQESAYISGRPFDFIRLRLERESVVVVLPGGVPASTGGGGSADHRT